MSVFWSKYLVKWIKKFVRNMQKQPGKIMIHLWVLHVYTKNTFIMNNQSTSFSSFFPLVKRSEKWKKLHTPITWNFSNVQTPFFKKNQTILALSLWIEKLLRFVFAFDVQDIRAFLIGRFLSFGIFNEGVAQTRIRKRGTHATWYYSDGNCQG